MNQSKNQHNKYEKSTTDLSQGCFNQRHELYKMTVNVSRHSNKGLLKLCCICFLFLCVLGGSIYGVQRFASFMSHNEQFSLTEIKVNTNGNLHAQRVIELASIKHSATLLNIDIDFIEQALLECPEIHQASVKKQFPNALEVTVTEHKALAWIHSPQHNIYGRNVEKGFLISEEGYIIPCNAEDWEVHKKLPLIYFPGKEKLLVKAGEKLKHAEITRASDLILTHQKMKLAQQLPIQAIEIKNFHTLDVSYNFGVLATFGMHSHERKIKNFVRITNYLEAQNDLKGEQKKLQWIDLRPKEYIPAVFADGRSDQRQAILNF